MRYCKIIFLFCFYILVNTSAMYAVEPDFKVGSLYFKIDSWENKTCIVWGPGEVNYYSYRNECPSGDIEIPDVVEYNGVRFRVVKIQGFDDSDRESPFLGNNKITSVYIPRTVKVIGDCAFQGCKNLVSVNMQGGISLGNGAFAECNKLKHLTLSHDLKYIGYKCFYDCNDLSSEVLIPSSCEWIGAQAFQYCYNMSLIIEDSEDPLELWPNVFYGGENIYIGRPIVDGNPQRPGWEQKFGSYAKIYTFRNVTFGNNVKEMPYFSVLTDYGVEKNYDTDWLQTLNIGTSITTVRNFDVDYIRIKAIYLNSSIPPISDGFNSNAYLNTILYVPKGSLTAYRAAPVWKNFLRIQEIDTYNLQIEPVTNLGVSGWVDGYEYVDLGLPSGTFWATKNIGANKPWEAGEYFAWGETSPKLEYSYENYAHCSWEDSCKYFNDSFLNERSDDIINPTRMRILEPIDDAASINWGGKWRMPTAYEWNELVKLCQWLRLPYSFGYKVIGPNGNSVFLPMAGCYEGKTLNEAKANGCYWASTYWYGYYISGDLVDAIWFGKWLDNYDYTHIVPFAGYDATSGLTIRPVWTNKTGYESLIKSVENSN